MSIAWLLVPGLWVVWFPLGCSPGLFFACALVVGLSILVPLVAYARAVGWVLVGLFFSRGVALILFGWFVYLLVCVVWFWFVSPLPKVWAWFYLVCLPVGFVSG